MTRHLTAAERAEFLTEAQRRLDAIGLGTEEAIDDNEAQDKERAARVAHLPPPRSVPFYDQPPELLQRKVIEEYATVDGAYDAAIGRPASAAVRYCEGLLHYNNYPHMRTYFEFYSAAYNEQKARLK